MKSDLVDEIKKQVRKKVPGEINSKGNAILRKSFPTKVSLNNKIDLSTVLTNVINIGENHIELPMDGTLFLSETGYARPHSTADMPHYSPEDIGEIQVFLNSYLLETLSNVINADVHLFQSTFMGIGYEIILDPKLGPTELSLVEGDFLVDTHPRIYSKTLKMGMEFEAILKLNPDVGNGDGRNMMDISPNVDNISLKSFRFIIFGNTINLDPSTAFLNSLLRLVLNWIVIPTIDVPKQEILPLKVTKSQLDFHQLYSELGISFNLGK
mmetsp:Transcript_17117/g.15081  ORF Transcript_17117/g.15081 Transcript_17117/m.15081 type:complete len:268 (+) Transcript_17117:565-1368(+)